MIEFGASLSIPVTRNFLNTYGDNATCSENQHPPYSPAKSPYYSKMAAN